MGIGFGTGKSGSGTGNDKPISKREATPNQKPVSPEKKEIKIEVTADSRIHFNGEYYTLKSWSALMSDIDKQEYRHEVVRFHIDGNSQATFYTAFVKQLKESCSNAKFLDPTPIEVRR